MSNQTSKNPRVSYAEAMIFTRERVGTWLGGKQWPEGLSIRRVESPAFVEAYGFLFEMKRPLFFRWRWSRQTSRIARLLLKANFKDLKVSPREWLLEVHGVQHAEFFQDLANELAKEFQVDIHVRLETPRELR